MIAVKEEGDQAMAEKDEQIEEEMTRMRTEWQSAVSSEARLTEEVSTLTLNNHSETRDDGIPRMNVPVAPFHTRPVWPPAWTGFF